MTDRYDSKPGGLDRLDIPGPVISDGWSEVFILKDGYTLQSLLGGSHLYRQYGKTETEGSFQ